jgi:transposase
VGERFFKKSFVALKLFSLARVCHCEPMSVALQPPKITSLEQARTVIAEAFAQLQQLQWRVKQLEQELFGPSSERQADERLSKEQILLSLFPEAAEPAATQEVLLPAEEAKRPARPRRQPAVKVLETVTERIEPEEKICPQCGRAKCEIGCEKSERYEYIPAKIIRHETLRPRLACRCGQGGVSIAPLPPSVIDQGLPGPGLVAHVILSKYDDHLPLYRQQQQFARLGVNFSRQSLCDWVSKGAEWFSGVVGLMKGELLAGDYVQVDETPVRVMDPEVPGRCAMGYLWVAGRPGEDVIFEFHPGRGKEYAGQLTEGFCGYLQRDGYGAYESLVRERPGLIAVGCWSHARRKFVDALEERPQEAGAVVTEVRKVYLIERHARDDCLSAAQRLELRQEKSAPILAALKPRLEGLLPGCLPQSPLGKAIRYTLAEWEPLTRYLADGRLEIDNNLTENAIRPSAVGKKNWLFIGHPEAGWRSAVIYSVIVSCRRRGIDPWEYLSDVLKRLPGMKQSELPTILPRCWKPLGSSVR